MVHGMNDDGRTPFDIAIEKGYFGLAQQLKNLADNTGQEDLVDEMDVSTSTSTSTNSDEDDEIRDRFLANRASRESIDSIVSSEPSESFHSSWNNSQWMGVGDDTREGPTSVRESETIQAQLDLMRTLQDENFVLKEAEKAAAILASNMEHALAVLERKNSRLQTERDDAIRETDELLNGVNLSNKSMEELTEMETRLRSAMESIAHQKEAQQEEKNFCVVCQAATKTVLLMPCRHLCVCKECSEREELEKCPLCRQIITQKIDVYA